MPDMGAIAAAIGSLKTAADIAKGFLDLKEAAAVQGRVIELQGVILAAQSSALAAQSDQFSLLEEIRDLKTKMAELETWVAEKKRYGLKDVSGRGEFAYVIKKSEQHSEPTHAICANCYQQEKKSILQWSGRGYDSETHWKCPVCDNLITMFGPMVPL
jgi:hypothetical protein